jgi:serine/threonine protein kinase
LRHPNILQFLGLFEDEYGELFMVTELAVNGSLEQFLKKHHPPAIQLLKMAHGIATGMCLLESRRLVHRDLALRNVLVCQYFTQHHQQTSIRTQLTFLSGFRRICG